MDKSKLKQISNKIQKSLNDWDYIRAIHESNNKAQTRDYLIEPFLNFVANKIYIMKKLL